MEHSAEDDCRRVREARHVYVEKDEVKELPGIGRVHVIEGPVKKVCFSTNEGRQGFRRAKSEIMAVQGGPERPFKRDQRVVAILHSCGSTILLDGKPILLMQLHPLLNQVYDS